MAIARLFGLHAAAAFLFSLSPCDPTDGDDGGSASSSGTAALDPSAFIATLTPAQKAELCDWQAGQLGGYGTTTSCPSGGSGVALPASQAACVANFASSTDTCQATVQDDYNCVNFLVDSPCLTTLDEAPECEPIVSCD
ncbi:MAG TPA: hypothetical protein VK841_00820 [Polyangiaceae bacterium]|jgi:hypothetical protein|nr:hypothetical protein [Polyangiaceae bacterium]